MKRTAIFDSWIMLPLGLVDSAQEIGLFWDSEQVGWIRPGLPPLRMMTGPIQHLRSAICQAWQDEVAVG